MSWKYNLAAGGLLKLAFDFIVSLSSWPESQEFGCCVFIVFLLTEASTGSPVIRITSSPVYVFRWVKAFLCLTVLFSSVAFVVDAFNQP